MAMQNLTWMVMSFVFMMVIVPMLGILTISINSTLPIGMILWIRTPLFTLVSVLIAYWFLSHRRAGWTD